MPRVWLSTFDRALSWMNHKRFLLTLRPSFAIWYSFTFFEFLWGSRTIHFNSTTCLLRLILFDTLFLYLCHSLMKLLQLLLRFLASTFKFGLYLFLRVIFNFLFISSTFNWFAESFTVFRFMTKIFNALFLFNFDRRQLRRSLRCRNLNIFAWRNSFWRWLSFH